jgi:hypothetical protein
MSNQTAGKRKQNKSLKAWVAFVKKVQKEEKLSYKDAIHRAKVRKDKGEKWMMGGSSTTPISDLTEATSTTVMEIDEEELPSNSQKRGSENNMSIQTKYQATSGDQGRIPTVIEDETIEEQEEIPLDDTVLGQTMNSAPYGGKRRRTMRKRGARRTRGRTARKSRGRGRGRGRH